MFSNLNTFGILIPKVVWNRHKFLYYFFKWFTIRDISSVNFTNFILKFTDKTFFFLIIFNDSLMFILDEIFIDNDIYY